MTVLQTKYMVTPSFFYKTIIKIRIQKIIVNINAFLRKEYIRHALFFFMVFSNIMFIPYITDGVNCEKNY